MKKFLIAVFTAASFAVFGQKEAHFEMTVSSDTVGLNGELAVSFTLKNAKMKHFETPKFEGFQVFGPSTSTNMSFINGEMTQSATYTYTLKPIETGNYRIPKVQVKTENGILETTEKKIVVVQYFEMPEKEQPQMRGFFGDNPFFFPQKPAPRQAPPKREKPKKDYGTEDI